MMYQGGTATLAAAVAEIASLTYVDPSFHLADGIPSSYMPTYDVTWTMTGPAPQPLDQVEVWVRSLYAGSTVDGLGGSNDLAPLEWKLRASVPYADLAATVTAMHFWTDHEIAVRVVSGGLPGAGYFGAPDTWPVASRATLLAEGDIVTWGPPTPFYGDTEVTLVLGYEGPGMNGKHLQPQLTWEADKDPGTGFVAAGINPAVEPSQIVHPNADIGSTFDYRARVVGPDGASPYATIAAYTIPPP
jgi:hypothetical protein